MAILGLDVGPFSLRELRAMVDLKRELDWEHTSTVVAMIHNSRFGIKKHQMTSPDKINPYIRGRARQKRGGKIRLASMARGFGVK